MRTREDVSQWCADLGTQPSRFGEHSAIDLDPAALR